mmetsp:Transcript_11887/g.27866  ORF Transcript_11887/g.27866 Transcript_11887/m.27866 type:complete len:283 (+) Transcript_11887:1772-2620(+)
MKGALMGLVDHHDRVAPKVGLAQKLAQQHSIRHILDHCRITGTIFEPNRIAYFLPQLHSQLLANPGCNTHGRHAPWLGAPDHSDVSVAHLVEILRQLRRLARTRLAHHDKNLVVLHSSQKLVTIRISWKFLSPCQNLFMLREFCGRLFLDRWRLFCLLCRALLFLRKFGLGLLRDHEFDLVVKDILVAFLLFPGFPVLGARLENGLGPLRVHPLVFFGLLHRLLLVPLRQHFFAHLKVKLSVFLLVRVGDTVALQILLEPFLVLGHLNHLLAKLQLCALLRG